MFTNNYLNNFTRNLNNKKIVVSNYSLDLIWSKNFTENNVPIIYLQLVSKFNNSIFVFSAKII